MPKRPNRACSTNACPNSALPHDSHCVKCKRQRRRAKRQGSSTARGYGATWRKLRIVILHRDPYCKAPDCTWPAEEVDHILPKQLGGTDDPENLQGLCSRHHDEKTEAEQGWTYKGRGRTPATIVCGPPASGKTTFVERNRKPGDLVYDFDAVAEAITGEGRYECDRDFAAPYITAAREAIIRQWASRRHVGGHFWLILSGASSDQRARYRRKLLADVVVLKVSAAECIKRVAKDMRRRNQLAYWEVLIEDWYSKYEPDPADRVLRGASASAAGARASA